MLEKSHTRCHSNTDCSFDLGVNTLRQILFIVQNYLFYTNAHKRSISVPFHACTSYTPFFRNALPNGNSSFELLNNIYINVKEIIYVSAHIHTYIFMDGRNANRDSVLKGLKNSLKKINNDNIYIA